MGTKFAIAVAAFTAVVFISVAPGAGDASAEPAGASGVEDIYVLRSVREARVQPAPVACATARTKLSDPAWEDSYTFRSVATRAEDGRVIENEANKVGSIRACFGKTADPAVMELYGDAMINGIAAKAFGKCQTAKRDFPEKGVNLFGCLFELSDLPAEYIGGQLTTNSLTSTELFGTTTNPKGYAQVSIATVRLWRKR
jgi:hypothetical protein